MVSITGDTATGKRVAKIAAETVKRLHLELGGKAPVIVFDDADLDLAAETLKAAGYWNAGQDCTAATRVLAGPKVYDNFVEKLAEQVRSIKWGDPAEADDIDMGSLIAQAQADKVQGMVDRARTSADVVVGGNRPDRAGAYYEPTIIAGPDQKSEIIQDEIFGPVVTVQRFSDEETGRRVGERHAVRPRVLAVHLRHRPGDARGEGARVRPRLDQRALHPGLGDAARRRQAVGLGQGRLEVRARGLHVHQARDDQHRRLTPGTRSHVSSVAARPPMPRTGFATAGCSCADTNLTSFLGDGRTRPDLSGRFVRVPIPNQRKLAEHTQEIRPVVAKLVELVSQGDHQVPKRARPRGAGPPRVGGTSGPLGLSLPLGLKSCTLLADSGASRVSRARR